MAIPCGLIINELISNALKYAFKGREKGVITIALWEENQQMTLVVEDDGIGIPAEIDYRKTESLGLQLVNTLAEQLEGKLQLHMQKGTKFSLVFSTKEE
jgi:two-component sensor histidine kinase